jgi:two-component system, OmpR family, KDP operon response regulator KdpE
MNPGTPAEILLIEDDENVRRFLRATLGAEGYHLEEAHTGAEGLAQATSCQPELLLVDLGLPDRDGIGVIADVRKFSHAPILVISARGQESDKIAALDAGADDYVSKPFQVGELLARIRAALRRSARLDPGLAAEPVRFGGVEVDLEKRVVKLNGEPLRLTPIEYKLLQALLQNAGKVMTQRQLLHEVWGPHHVQDAQYLRVYMAQLRRKLESDPARPRHLHTEPGVGYRLVIE